MTGEHPSHFRDAVALAIDYVRGAGLPADEQLVFIASLNEWGEGHYLEPDEQHGLAWIEAVRDAR